ncbi:aminodeoxychorismate synthase component I [Aliikangiella coralliicola]|uniref:aminodeoxychorismate synthase n=1 Tax=Aliikangiella coralliicola TaxID=2592383 RepID=A0A545U507_9GAMM|nr:aminodeoxychorismate synthase component I [Aliikangiella coralliicola]TQV84555.1 aminodeoxychorismate synthase component I [Aliikangiella coralliicola]
MNGINLPYLSRESKLKSLAGLLKHPWAMLLDSGGNDINYNRYDIFCCRPTVQLTFKNEKVKVDSKINLPALKLDEPLSCMRKILNTLKPSAQKERTTDLPFNGGWLGYVSYDFGRHLEKIPEIASDDIDLAAIKMGLYQWALITDHHKQTTALYNFGLPEKEWHSVNQLINTYLTAESSQPIDSRQEPPQDFKIVSDWKSNTTKETYIDAFNHIQNYIREGDCYQVNYAQRFCADYSGDVFQAYQGLSEANKAPFSAYLNFNDHQILSLSPERFIESHDNKVITQPIKGTRPRSNDPKEDAQLAQALINSEKDQAENLMIVDLLRNDLSRTAATGSVKVTELFGHYKFASVHHLISTIESKLGSDFDNLDLLATTLPGGSITGAPKIRAMEIIEELEPVRRNLYCGIIGYIDFAGNMDTNICIRTLIAKDNRLYCWAGGGLVADSDALTEYQETFDKLVKILPILDEYR